MTKSNEAKTNEKAAARPKKAAVKAPAAKAAKKPAAKLTPKAKPVSARRKAELKEKAMPAVTVKEHIAKPQEPLAPKKKEKIPVKSAPAAQTASHPQVVQEAISPPKKEKAPAPVHETVLPVRKEKVQVSPQPVAAPARKEALPEISKAPVAPVQPAVKEKEVELKLPITVKDLAVKLQEKPSVLIKSLMDMKVMAGINQALAEETVAKICDKLGFRVKRAPEEEELALAAHTRPEQPQNLRPRAPIVTFMGHVDHGKTSLLDAIRKTKVTELEHGGITQHIGAYRVKLPAGEITFLDTPGHEAFTAMRARGAGITDIVVLVVAADEGIMPQTQEAIDHARAAGVPIVVAMNKVDKPQADVQQLKKQLSEVGLTAEDWGGKTITVPVSAKTGQGIDDLLEMILLESHMLELKANPSGPAKGIIIEAKLSKDKGPVATLLVQNGTVRLNDNVIVNKYFGKVRAMFDDRGKPVTEAGPSLPVGVLGLSGTPLPGEQFFVIEDEKTARNIALKRQEIEKQKQIKSPVRINLENLYAQVKEGKLKELKLIIKADVGGSLEAIRQTLEKMNISEIKLNFIHEGVGNINSSDVMLAVASDALILGFNIATDERARELIEKEGVDARAYNIIYELANDIKAALEGMLEPRLKKIFVGRAEVRKVFQLSRSGTVAGCFVVKGRVPRSANVSLVRNGQSVFEGKISSLKRFKDDVREVGENFECGITLAGFDDMKEGDLIEAFEIEKVARKL